MNNTFPSSKEIKEISGKIISKWHEIESSVASLEQAISLLAGRDRSLIFSMIDKQAIINTVLWHREDMARDTMASDSTIADTKRAIDRLNAARVDNIELIDEELYRNIELNPGAPMNTETPGSVMDRLTIFCLKEYHMGLEARRSGASEEHRQKCAQNLALIKKQISDLMSAYDFLVEEIMEGKRRFMLYRQFKMYNDPELNPVLYSKKQKEK